MLSHAPFGEMCADQISRSSGPVNIWNGAPLFVENLAEEVGNVEQQIKELERSHRDAVNDVSGHVETRKALTKKKGELNVRGQTTISLTFSNPLPRSTMVFCGFRQDSEIRMMSWRAFCLLPRMMLQPTSR